MQGTSVEKSVKFNELLAPTTKQPNMIAAQDIYKSVIMHSNGGATFISQLDHF